MISLQNSVFTPTAKSKENKQENTGEWMDFENPIIISVIAMRGGGKSGIADYMMQKYYDKHFTVLHLFSARSLENLYPIVNKNCGYHFSKIKQLIRHKYQKDETKRPARLSEDEEPYYMKIAEQGNFIRIYDNDFTATHDGFDLVNNKLLHCECKKALPVLLLVPDYIEFDQDSLDRFNGVFWSGVEEYSKFLFEISSSDKQLLFEGKLRKPDYLIPIPLLKVVQFIVPTTDIRILRFREEWTDSVLQARAEHRILVMSPLFFDGLDKFTTLEQIATYHAILMNTTGHFDMLTEKQVGKPYKQWSLKQKNYHKIALFIDEARSVVPSSKLHGEAGAGKSKKAMFDKVPEMRHYKTWLHFLYQNPMDVYDGIRHNDNMTIMKRTSSQLAGADWKWLFDKIERDRFGFMKKITKGRCDHVSKLKIFESKYPNATKFIDARRPRLESIHSDKAYVIRYGKFRLIKNSMGSWHHKQEMESIKGDTGITWKINREKRPEDSTKSKVEEKKEMKHMKAIKFEIFKRMKFSFEKEKKGWDAIGKDLIQMQTDGLIPDMGFEGKDKIYLSNLYNRWKKKYGESVPDSENK